MAFSYVDTLGFKDAINGGKPLKPATQFTINCLGAGEQVGTVMAINAAGIATACTVVAWTDTLLTLITPPNIVEGVGYRVEVTLYGENIPAYYGETKADTFADLRTIEPTIENQVIMLLGDTGGNFQYIAGSAKTDDGKDCAVTVDGKVWARISTNIQKKPVDTIVMMGDSIMAQSFEDGFSRPLTQYDLRRYGLSGVTFVETAVGGSKVSDVVTLLDSIIDSYDDKNNVLFVVQVGVNDFNAAGDYATADEDKLYSMGSGYQHIIETIRAKGHNLLFSNITYTATAATEQEGTKPYNENILYPVLDRLNKKSINDLSEITYIDLYSLMLDNPSYFEVDNLHPNSEGEQAIRDLFFNVISNLYDAQTKVITPKIGEKIVIDFSDEDLPNTNPLISNQFRSYGFTPTNTLGFDSASVVCDYFSSQNVGGRGNTGNETASLDNDILLQTFWVLSDSDPRIIKIGNIKPSTTATVSFTASYPSGTSRKTYIEHEGTTLTLNSYTNPPEKISFDVVFDVNGEVSFSVEKDDADGFCVLSGMQVEFT